MDEQGDHRPGDIVRFTGYVELQDGQAPIFQPGARVCIERATDEGGFVVSPVEGDGPGDTVFPEEIEAVSSAEAMTAFAPVADASTGGGKKGKKARRPAKPKARIMSQIVRFTGYFYRDAADRIFQPGDFVRIDHATYNGGYVVVPVEGNGPVDALFPDEFRPATSDADISAAVATVVRDAHARGVTSLHEIALTLPEMGLPTPSDFTGPWTADMVQNALDAVQPAPSGSRRALGLD